QKYADIYHTQPNDKFNGYHTFDIFVTEFAADVGYLEYLEYLQDIVDIKINYVDISLDNAKIYTIEEGQRQLLYIKSEISKILINDSVDYIVKKTGGIDNVSKRSYLIVNETTSDILTELLCCFIGQVEQYQVSNFAELKDKLDKTEISK
ncbi:MAG: hypothetical protein HN879_10020, partial [Flavobacteriaceae bacterium]|nr:hypothetical protein [Flavobacteriaceae bacterium]